MNNAYLRVIPTTLAILAVICLFLFLGSRAAAT